MPNLRKFLFIFSATLSVSLTSCGEKKASPPSTSTSTLDLSKHDILQFKAASSAFGTGGSRYDLSLTEGTVEKFEISSESSVYESKGKQSLSPSLKSEISGKIGKLTSKKWGSCADCTQTRASVWIEITETTSPLYYFAYNGDCSCADDGANAATLKYSELKTIYDQLLGAF